MNRGKSLSFAWPESFVQRYWIDGTKIGNFFKLRQILVCFVLFSDAKRQWGQSPEIEDSTESKDDPTSPRYAMSGFHITMCGFLAAAAIDARPRTCQPRPAKSAETCPRRHDKIAAGRPKDAPTGHGSPPFCPLKAYRFGHVEALH